MPRSRPGGKWKFVGARDRSQLNASTRRAVPPGRRNGAKQRYCVTWFRESFGGFPVRATSASTSLIWLYIGSWSLPWTIQYAGPGGWIHPDRPNCVAWFHPFPSSCLFQIPRVTSPVDIESRQMPKRSIREDKLKLMCGRRSIKKIKSPEGKKPSDTAPKAPAVAAASKATASKPSKPSKPLNIPLSDVSPEFKRLVVI